MVVVPGITDQECVLWLSIQIIEETIQLSHFVHLGIWDI